jgi:hypothetical protein
MNEPKKRGRPAKVQAGDGHIAVITHLLRDQPVTTAAQAYANRVWAGQSADVKHEERIARVKRALAGQNLPFEGVVLP